MSSTAATRPTSSSSSVASARLLGGRYVYDQHDANPELAITKWGDRRSGRLLVRPDPDARACVVCHGCLSVIVPNESYARSPPTRGGVAADRIVVVRNAPPGDRFRALAAGIDRADRRTLRLGYLGVMGSQDGVEILLDAVAVAAGSPGRTSTCRGRPRRRRRGARGARGAGPPGWGSPIACRFHGYRRPEAFVPHPGGDAPLRLARPADAVQRRVDDDQGRRVPGHRSSGRRLRAGRDDRGSSATRGASSTTPRRRGWLRRWPASPTTGTPSPVLTERRRSAGSTSSICAGRRSAERLVAAYGAFLAEGGTGDADPA